MIICFNSSLDGLNSSAVYIEVRPLKEDCQIDHQFFNKFIHISLYEKICDDFFNTTFDYNS